MNELSEIDQALLKDLKRRVEQRAGLSGSADLSQKDFDFLLYYIEEKTGEALSLTTIKRIWRNEYQRLPHLSTLNMLAQLAHDSDWYTLKKQYVEQNAQTTEARHPIEPQPSQAPIHSVPQDRRRTKILMYSSAVILLAFMGYYASTGLAPDSSGIQFSAEATTDMRIPNTVVFSYDLNGYKADHFYIQQNWDPEKRVEISAVNKKQTDIYYEPGYHYAKLIGNDRVLKEIAVHVRYNDWFVRFRYPDSKLVKVKETALNTEGHLGLKPESVNQFAAETPFQLGFMLSKDFNLSADEFQISAMIRFDSALAPSCPMVNLLVKGDKDYVWITLGNKGCESNLGIKVGDESVSGKSNDLSSLGIEAFSWQGIQLRLSNGTYKLYVNNEVAYEGEYSKKLGDLKEIDLFFNGIGNIDEINIADNNQRSLISQSFN